MNRNVKRILSLLLALLMFVSLMPAAVFADEGLDEVIEQFENNTVETEEQAGPQPVRVEFKCEPADIVLTVWNKESKLLADALDNMTESERIEWIENNETEPLPEKPEEDGSYLLMPGDFLYFAECEGYEGVSDAELVICEQEEPLTIDVCLEKEQISLKSFASVSAPTLGASATSGKCGDNVRWSFSAGVLTISGTGRMYDYSAESTPWYSIRYSIVSIIIGNGVTSIGDHSFFDCNQSLTNVTIPTSVTSIGSGAFVGCTTLPTITIPSSVTTIGKGAFEFCSSLESITIPSGIKTIDDLTFFSCNNLSTITIPSSITYIGENVFTWCYVLNEVYYSGSKSQRDKIIMVDDSLNDATWHYNASPFGSLSISETSISMDVKGSNTKKLSYQYNYSNSDYYLQCSCDSQSSPAAVVVSKWDQNNKTIFLIAQAAGKSTINLKVRNKNTQELVASASCVVTVTARNKGSYFKFGIDTFNFNNGQNDLGNYYISDYDYKSLIEKNMSAISRRYIINYIQNAYGKKMMESALEFQVLWGSCILEICHQAFLGLIQYMT